MSYTIGNKIALVTGANRGIGKSIVEHLLANGAKKVYLAVRNTASTGELEKSYGDRVKTLRADVADKRSIQALAEQATDVDVVINNAGILASAPAIGADTEAALKNELDINLFGLLNVANAFAPALEQNKGALVQLNSVVSIRNFSAFATYSVSKAASYSLTQALRETLAPKGVKVVSVHPGPIDTDMGAQAGFDQVAPASVVAQSILEALEKDEFHAFPDEMAKMFGEGYKSYADNFVTADLGGE
ncbi:SDR family oxidoreductase [Aliiglaciecola sp. M165]|uniref:SDR family oxidoreductase n=1 Tax=Aliiglaciecola sp. M165 TaxID=2593649 RepID=UPI0011810C62|nr:SDR family oxidoreductase [Aliiglaciecola sp. M165]TRY31743.1 SDR family NAD(P)-dependent oxidoreductase [Aliiglaciecola sp. M165]